MEPETLGSDRELLGTSSAPNQTGACLPPSPPLGTRRSPTRKRTLTCCIFSKSRQGRCGLGVCRCFLRGETALMPPFSAGPAASGASSFELRLRGGGGWCACRCEGRVSILGGGETDRSGLCASSGGDVLNSTGGRVPVVRTQTSSSLLPAAGERDTERASGEGHLLLRHPVPPSTHTYRSR